MSDGYRMSRFKHDKLNLKCKEHQVLNKYYLKSEKKFVCEYDGFDNEGPDSFLHLPQILEQNRARIIQLQQNSMKQTPQKLIDLIPYVSSEFNNLHLESHGLNSRVENFHQNFLLKLKDIIFSNESFADIKEIIDQINWSKDGKPDLRKIGMDANKELNLITLAQLLVLDDGKDIGNIQLYKSLTEFLDEYQDQLITFINYSTKTVDLINGQFAEEIARVDGKVHDSNSRFNKFRYMFITSDEYNKAFLEKDREIERLNGLLLEREKNYNELKNENIRLNEHIKELLNDKNIIKSLEEQINSLNLKFKNDQVKHGKEINELKEYYEKLLREGEMKANDYYKKRIGELEKLLSDSEIEHDEIKHKLEAEIMEIKKKNELFLLNIREDQKLVINDYESKLLNEKTTTKKMALEKDGILAKYNELLNKAAKFEDEIKYLNLSNDKKVHYMDAQMREIMLIKEKIEHELEQERLRYKELNSENAELQEKRKEINMKLVEFDEQLKTRKLEEDKKIAILNNQISELLRAKDVYDRKYNALEISLQEERSKYNSALNLQEKKHLDLQDQVEELRRINNGYIDRISELEKEVYDLRNQITRLEGDKNGLSQTIYELQNQINLQIANSKNLKNEESRKLTELSGQVGNFPKIKELLNNRIKVLEDELAKEKSEFSAYQKEAEERIHNLQIQYSDTNSNNITLTHQLELIKSELDNEKVRQQKKINDLTNLLQDLTKLKDKNQTDFIEEKSRLNQQIMELERKLKDLTFEYEDHAGKNDYNFKRVRELEMILGEERKKYENYVKESEKRISDLNNKILELQRANETLQRKIIELEHNLSDEQSKNSQLIYEKENLLKIYKEKDSNLAKVVEDMKKNKLEDDRTISELSSRIKDLTRTNQKYEHRITDLEELLKSEQEKNTNGCYTHENLIKNLQVKFDEALRAKDQLDKENSDVRAKYKALLIEKENLNEKRKHLEHNNAQLNDENEELKKYKETYFNLKKEYENLVEQNEHLNERLAHLEDEFNKERARYNQSISSLKDKIEELETENQQLLQYKDRLEKEIIELKNRLKQLQMEYDLLQAKLDEQYAELNALRDANKNANNLLKNIQILNLQNEELNNRIKILESELADKSKKLEDANYKLQNYQDKVRELQEKIENLQKIIDNLEEQLRAKNLVKSEPKREIVRDYRNIDFLVDDYNDLLINKRNWPIVEPWLLPLRTTAKGNLKLNLLYKATRDGFSHNNFKERCLQKPNTLVVVFTEFNKLIGGFTPLAWHRPVESHEYSKDESKRTFLFSITSGKKFKLTKTNYAICNSRELGPIFGGGSDLEIVSDCNRFSNNYSHIGHSFDYTGPEEDFYGRKKFTVRDYEVYEVLL